MVLCNISIRYTRHGAWINHKWRKAGHDGGDWVKDIRCKECRVGVKDEMGLKSAGCER